MQLTKRLQAVADLVTCGSRVADVGCDHAYISIYLAEHNISPAVIAMDINKGPLERAKANIVKYGYDMQIETRLSNGLKRLKPNESDSIIIAGMGGALIADILTEGLEVMHSAKELILQPQSEIHKVRQLLSNQNFLIIRENMLIEDGKYYTMMKAIPANACNNPDEYILSKEEHFYFGKMLLDECHPVLKDYLLWDLGICRGILNELKAEASAKATARRQQINDRIKLINSGLKYYNR
jgi:tRNA (adenine22-N1)-methyltransferase